MQDSRWVRAKQIVAEAIERTEGEARATFIAEACGGDAVLREQVDLLLAAHRVDHHLPATPDVAAALEADDATIVSPTTERPGASIGRYRILEPLEIGRAHV